MWFIAVGRERTVMCSVGREGRRVCFSGERKETGTLQWVEKGDVCTAVGRETTVMCSVGREGRRVYFSGQRRETGALQWVEKGDGCTAVGRDVL
jgi:hypothetical protein